MVDQSFPDLIRKRLEIEPGVQLAYAEKGPVRTGPGLVLLFVPGFTFSSDVFGHQLEGLSERHRVLLLDPRSQGDSTVTETGNDYAAHAEDLKAFINMLGLHRVVLIGWSFGAMATWGYSALEMHRLVAHVCIDMPPVPLSDEADVWVDVRVAEAAAAYRALNSSEGQEAFIREYSRQVMMQRELTDAELDWLANMSRRTPYRIAASLLASGLFSDCLEAAQTLEQRLPSRFYIAHHWKNLVESYLSARLPKSSRAVFGGHAMFWEYPEQFNRDLDTFVCSL